MTNVSPMDWIVPSELDGTVAPSTASTITDALRRDIVVRDPGLPAPTALYNPAHEKDACGVGFVADMKNRRSHAIVAKGLDILRNLVHRGAVGADPKAGDGCGMLVQIPHRFFKEETAKLGFALPEPGSYAVGQFFLPRDPTWRRSAATSSRRRSPTRASACSASACRRPTMPTSASR